MEPRIQLRPGVYLRAIQTEKFKTGCLSLNFVRPLTPTEAPLAALLPSVLLRGTAHYPDIRAISSFLDEHYGASVGTLVRKKGEILTTGFYADFLEEKFLPAGEQVFAPMLDFLGELLFAPRMDNGSFLPDAFEGEKQNLLDSIDWRLNDKRAYAQEQMLRVMCANEAYGIPRLGDRVEAEKITRESLADYYRHLLSHSRLELFYMGRRSPEEVAKALNQMLAPLPSALPDAAFTCVNADVGEVRYVSKTMDITQGKLCMGFRTGLTGADPEYPAMMLFGTVYGGGATSKLFMNVREKRSLCYYVSASLDRFKGLMTVSSGIEAKNYDIVQEEILRQLDACVQGQITEEELECARRSLLSSLTAFLDSPGRIDEYMLGCALSGSEVPIEDLMERLSQVTLEQVVAAAKRVRLDTVYFLKGASE